jgi:hypothetical protein
VNRIRKAALYPELAGQKFKNRFHDPVATLPVELVDLSHAYADLIVDLLSQQQPCTMESLSWLGVQVESAGLIL